MAERFYGYGVSPQGNKTYTAKIYDAGFSGTSLEVDIEVGGILLDWESDSSENRHDPILGSRCTLNLLIPVGDTVREALVDDIRSSAEGTFSVEITSDGTYPVVWQGILVADTLSNERDEAARFRVSFSAVCGLALLRKVPYYNNGALYFNSNNLIGHIARALRKLSHTGTFWPGTETFVETSVDWWASGWTAGGANDPLNLANADHAAFYDYHTTGNTDKDVLSCYDVLRNICLTFGCRIYQMGGRFRVEQIFYRKNSTYETRTYDKNANFLANSARTGVNTINQSNFGAKVATVEYDYLPQISKAQLIYEAKVRRNFWQGIQLVEGSTFNFNQEISANSGATTFRLQTFFTVNIKNNTYSGNTTDVIIAEMRIFLKVGSNYLKRTVTFGNFGAQYNAASWTGSASDKFAVVTNSSQVPPVGTSKSYYAALNGFVTPALPSDGSVNQVSATFFQLKKNNGDDVDESQFTITWTAQSLWMEVYDLGTPDVAEDELLHESLNPDGGTDVWEATTVLGNGGSGTAANYAGRLMDGTNAVLTLWGAGTDARDKKIGDLLVRDVVNGQHRPTKRMNGTLYGTLDPMKLVRTSDGIDWLVSRLTWDMTRDVFTGSWIEMNYGTSATISTPVKRFILGGVKTPATSFPFPPLPTGGGNQGFAQNAPPTVLTPISFNSLNASIEEGDTITNIAVSTAMQGNEFLVGDLVTLVHPISGQYQDFEVSSIPGLGATSISVTSAAAQFDAPVGTGLFIKQKAYAFSMPVGTHLGQILRWTGTDWVIYSGTPGDSLTWDPTNGWVATAGGGGYTDEQAQDAVGGILSDSAEIDFTYDDGTPSMTAVLITTGVTPGTYNLLTVDSKGRVTAASTVAYLTGNQTITLSGNVTGSGTTSITVTISNNAVTTAKIQDAAVTLAKIQDIATARFLGRVTGGTGVVEQLTATQMQTALGFVDGAGVANRLAYWSDANTIANNAAFAVDPTNGRMTVTNITPGFGIGQGIINIPVPTGGTNEIIRADGNVSGNILISVHNVNGINSAANTIMTLGTGGAGGGDPIVQFVVSGVATWAIGTDNSDGDKWKITPNSTPGGTANTGMTLTRDAATRVGINRDAPLYPLDVNGRVRGGSGFMGTFAQWNAGLIAFGSGAGTTPILNSISGTDNALYISFTTGGTMTNNGVIFTATYPNAWANSAFVTFSADGTNNSASDITLFRTGNRLAASFQFIANGTLPAGKNYQFCFMIFSH